MSYSSNIGIGIGIGISIVGNTYGKYIGISYCNITNLNIIGMNINCNLVMGHIIIVIYGVIIMVMLMVETQTK